MRSVVRARPSQSADDSARFTPWDSAPPCSTAGLRDPAEGGIAKDSHSEVDIGFLLCLAEEWDPPLCWLRGFPGQARPPETWVHLVTIRTYRQIHVFAAGEMVQCKVLAAQA